MTDRSDLFIVAVSLIIECDGCVLFMHRSNTKDHAAGEWEFVSGRLEYDETIKQAVMREAAEETGLTLEIVNVFDTFQFRRGPNLDYAVGITFHCQKLAGEVRLSSEHDDYHWQSLNKDLEIELQPGVLDCFNAFRAHRNGFAQPHLNDPV